MRSILNNERGNWTLIGLLVAVCVGFALMFFVLMPKLNSGEAAKKEGLVQPKPGQTVVGASLDKGKETECASNLRQIRMMLESSKASGETAPATIDELKLGSAGRCPVSNQAYQYDPNTGQVRCAAPGHERL